MALSGLEIFARVYHGKCAGRNEILASFAPKDA